MISDTQLEQLFADRKTPDGGRKLIRRIRTDGPVRQLQGRMSTVRTRFISTKMQRALYAESRTVELPGIIWREHDKETLELWPQACQLDIFVETQTGSTRLQHIPDLFSITTDDFVMEEWREEARLEGLAQKRPSQYYKDASGIWHNVPFEEHLAKLGITYRLRSADEHPRSYLANIRFLEDFSLESTPVVPESEAKRMTHLLRESNVVSHLELVHQHNFSADHIFQMVLDKRVFVDLHAHTLSRVEQLFVYRDELAYKAERLLKLEHDRALPSSACTIRVGSRFLFDDKPYEVVLLGKADVIVRDPGGATTSLGLDVVSELFAREQLHGSEQQTDEKEYDLAAVLAKQNRLIKAMQRLEAIQNPAASEAPERSLRRWRAAVRGITAPQDQLQALMSVHEGNRNGRLPIEAVKCAELALRKHNDPTNRTVSATYSFYVAVCDDHDIVPMSQSTFYKWVKGREDVVAREGKRKAYQKEPIPLTYDYEHPVHGVLPHEVVYCDHTIPNIFLKGMKLADLGKPTLSIMVDGAMTKTRAFYLSFQPPGTVAVLGCLRDYVRRNARLPRVLVLDNGKEFHSEALKLFCSLFGIDIRWRRASKPRDSTMVERMLGATEQEVISSLDGNSIALKDPRMVSTTHLPQKHIKWTLPALHGSLQHYLFDIHPNRIHPRLGMSPCDFERQQLLEYGARAHVMVRYDQTFKLLTASHSGRSTRLIDRIRGVFVDGMYYWNEKLALAKKGEEVEVRVEQWNAGIVYLCFRGDWFIGQARDGGRLQGRFKREFEQARREESKRARTTAANDKKSAGVSQQRIKLWMPELWDSRLREQMSEEYLLYDRLGMTEVMEQAKDPNASEVQLRMARGSDIPHLRAISNEPDLPAHAVGLELTAQLSDPAVGLDFDRVLELGSDAINDDDRFF